MKKVIFLTLLIFSPLSYGQEPEPDYKKGEVIRVVKQYAWKKLKGKSIVMVWNGKKSVQVIIPTQYMRKVFPAKVFPYKITVDTKTGKYVSQGRPVF